MARKTVPVLLFLEMMNEQIADKMFTSEERRILCGCLENILSKSGNYAGFNYNYWLGKDANDENSGVNQWRKAGEPDFPEKEKFILGPTGDEWNRCYAYSETMQEEKRKARK